MRVKFLGKKGELTAVLKGMKDVAPEERPKVGQLVNETRAAIEELLEETKVKMEAYNGDTSHRIRGAIGNCKKYPRTHINTNNTNLSGYIPADS